MKRVKYIYSLKHIFNCKGRYHMQTKQLFLKWRAKKIWNCKRGQRSAKLFRCFVILFLLAWTSENLQSFLFLEQATMQIKKKEIDYELFRDMELSEDKKFDANAAAVSFLWRQNGIERRGISEKDLPRIQKKLGSTKQAQELSQYYKALFQDLVCFPVRILKGETETIHFENTWRERRTYGGEREHEGIDMMASNNQRGYFTILSMSEGTIEKMGWNEQGGYRIGVRSENGLYCYYAHLHSYAPGLAIGSKVSSGAVLGLMGDSGYGKEEGTIGMFDVHLHCGIYMELNGEEKSINPYWLLKRLEKTE